MGLLDKDLDPDTIHMNSSFPGNTHGFTSEHYQSFVFLFVRWLRIALMTVQKTALVQLIRQGLLLVHRGIVPTSEQTASLPVNAVSSPRFHSQD